MTQKSYTVSGYPFIYHSDSTASLMWETSAVLLPAAAWGMYSFGLHALLIVLSSILSALATEAFVSGLRQRFTLGDGSAFLTGLLIGMAMPPSAPLLVPISASFFAVAIVKGAFGGLGSNWMNPALSGIVLALLCWPEEMTTWILPRQFSAMAGVSGASPVDFVRSRVEAGIAGSDPLSILHAGGFQYSNLDESITSLINRGLFGFLGAELPSGYVDLLLGNRAGALGELSGILLIAASIYLIARRIIAWGIPATILGTYALLIWIFGGLRFGEGFFSGDVLFSLFSGSILLVSFFMATDPVSSPSSPWGITLYGVGIGFLIFLFRSYGAPAEGTAFAVLIMNCLVPLFDRLEFKRRIGRRP